MILFFKFYHFIVAYLIGVEAFALDRFPNLLCL